MAAASSIFMAFMAFSRKKTSKAVDFCRFETSTCTGRKPWAVQLSCKHFRWFWPTSTLIHRKILLEIWMFCNHLLQGCCLSKTLWVEICDHPSGVSVEFRECTSSLIATAAMAPAMNLASTQPPGSDSGCLASKLFRLCWSFALTLA